MIFEQEYVTFEILDVMYLEQACLKMYNSNRNYDAISFRFEADTVIETGKRKTELADNAVCFVPSDLNYTRCSEKDKLIVVHFKSFNYHSNEIECIFPEDYNKYRKLFTEILDCWNDKKTSYKHECSALLNKIFGELYSDCKPACSKSKISNAVLYIEKNFQKKEFSLSEAAKKSYMSETYFRKLFKKEYGVSPKRYVIEKRMKHAEALILSGYFTLQEISDRCGYIDYKHFSVEFKKMTGISPSEYRYNYAIEKDIT